MVDWESDAKKERARMKICFDNLNQYAAWLALSGTDIADLRDLATGLGYYFGLNYLDSQHETLEEAFDSVVSDTLKAGKAAEITVPAKRSILKDIEYFAEDIESQGGMDEWAEEVRVLGKKLKKQWKLPDLEQFQDFFPFAQILGAVAFQGDRLTVRDGAYFESKEKVLRCLRLLPDYAASLVAAGETAEAVKAKCLACDMATFWCDEKHMLSTTESLDMFLIRLDKTVADAQNTGRMISAEEEKMIQEGVEAHIAELLDDPSAAILHLRTGYTGLINQIKARPSQETGKVSNAEEKQQEKPVELKKGEKGKKKTRTER